MGNADAKGRRNGKKKDDKENRGTAGAAIL